MTASPLPIRRALISVSDKSGIVAFAEALDARGVTIISTGGSAQNLAAAGIPVAEVAEVTGVAEFLDGRVKTLHPAIHAGLLARRDRPDHLAALDERRISPIDLLVCNLYPFAQTVASGASPEDCIENIDIGGVAMIRAAAKNHDAVTVVTDLADYDRVLAELAAGGGTIGAETRRALARKAFALTAAYDAAIAEWMGLDEPTAEAIVRLLIEVVIVPDADEAARAILARRTALRLLVTGEMPDPSAAGHSFRAVAGGILVQDRDRVSVGREGLRTVTRR